MLCPCACLPELCFTQRHCQYCCCRLHTGIGRSITTLRLILRLRFHSIIRQVTTLRSYMKTNANGCVRARIFWLFWSIIFASLPFCHLCEFRNGTRRVLKGVISSLRRIQNFDKRFISFDFTAWNVQELFGKVSELELIFCIENPIEIVIKPKTRGRIFLICTEFSIENLGVSSEIFSNNFCTFHAVSPKVMNIFS